MILEQQLLLNKHKSTALYSNAKSLFSSISTTGFELQFARTTPEKNYIKHNIFLNEGILLDPGIPKTQERTLQVLEITAAE